MAATDNYNWAVAGTITRRMLTIRNEQMQLLEQQRFETFLRRLQVFLQANGMALDDLARLRVLVLLARDFNFRSELAMARFAELMLRYECTDVKDLSKAAQNCLYAYRVPPAKRLEELAARLSEESVSSRALPTA